MEQGFKKGFRKQKAINDKSLIDNILFFGGRLNYSEGVKTPENRKLKIIKKIEFIVLLDSNRAIKRLRKVDNKHFCLFM